MNKTIKLGDIVYAMICWIGGGIIYSSLFAKNASESHENIIRDVFTCISLLAVFKVIIWVNSKTNKVE